MEGWSASVCVPGGQSLRGKGLKWHALVWARLDGCILDKVPRASVSRASWAGRRGQSCSIQLRILDITVLVARVLETREVKGVWGVRQPKNDRVRETDTLTERDWQESNVDWRSEWGISKCAGVEHIREKVSENYQKWQAKKKMETSQRKHNTQIKMEW